MEGEIQAEGEEGPYFGLQNTAIMEEANAIRARIEACPVHMSSATAFVSALAAHICMAVDAPIAFCFVRDVETEQLLGVYSAQKQKSPAQPPSSPGKRQEGQEDCSPTVSSGRPQQICAASKQTTAMPHLEMDSLQKRFNSLRVGPGKEPLGTSLQPSRVSFDSLSPEESAFFSSLMAQDARASNSFVIKDEPSPTEEAQGTFSSSCLEPSTSQSQAETERAGKPNVFRLADPDAEQDNLDGELPVGPELWKNTSAVSSSPQSSSLPEFIAVSSDSLVGLLMGDLMTGARMYAYEPVTENLSALHEETAQEKEDAETIHSPTTGKGKCVLIASRLEDKGARSACVAMAAERAAYMGSSGIRTLPSLPNSGTHGGSRMDGAANSARQAQADSIVSITGALKTSFSLTHLPMEPTARFPQATRGSQENVPVLFPATIETLDGEGGPCFQSFSSFSRALPKQTGSSLPGSPGTMLSTDFSLLATQPDVRPTLPTARSALPVPAHSQCISRPSVDNGRCPHTTSPPSVQYMHLSSTLGIIFCLNAKRPDAHLLIEAVAKSCSSPLALLLQQQWLRRDRFKRMLQLELHRTVFQETSIPLRMMQRLLALLHAAVGVEAAAFFIADAQNRNFICLGGHKRATGLCLSGSHKLLGKAMLHGGNTVVCNFLPTGFNKEYDARAHFETKHAMLIPLLSTQGHLKAVVVLLNRYQCSCERPERLEENLESQCACSQQVRALEPFSLAVDAWSAAAAPCENCNRKRESELSYGEFFSKPPSSLDTDCSRHFIRIHEMVMRAVQCEMKNSLGGQLTNVCMAGMSMLQPMETMVSYVMGEQERSGRRPLGAVMAQIENFVLRDRRMKLLSLRRCASVAVTEQLPPHGESGASKADNSLGATFIRRVNKSQRIASSPRHQNAVTHKMLRASTFVDRRARHKWQPDDSSDSPDRWSRGDLPIYGAAGCSTDSALYDQRLPLFHSSSAPLDAFIGLRHPSNSEEISSSTKLVENEQEADDWLSFRHRRTMSLPSLVFSATLQNCTGPFDTIRKQLSLEPYRRLDLDVWRRTAEELELFFFLALEELGVMVKSEKKNLQAFFGIIRDAYHTDNPYHNFYHGIHVTQMCWIFLTRYSCRDALSPTEQLGLLLAALAHDVDHPGVNNSNLCEQQHPLAIIYNDKAVLENHHAAFAARTMMQLGMFSQYPTKTGSTGKPMPTGHAALKAKKQRSSTSSALHAASDKDSDDFEDKDDKPFYPSFAEIRRVLINCILSTDMELFRHHHEAMRKRAQVKRTTGELLNSDEDRALLVTCLIHCADISNPLLPERRNMQWASLVVQEFNAQVEMERHKGLPVTVFMDARTELLRTQSQIGFLSFVVLDQFRALADLVPDAEELVLQGEKNLEDWQSAMDVLREVERRDTLGESVSSLEIPRNFMFRLKDLSFKGINGPKCFGRLRSDKADDWRPQSLDT